MFDDRDDYGRDRYDDGYDRRGGYDRGRRDGGGDFFSDLIDDTLEGCWPVIAGIAVIFILAGLADHYLGWGLTEWLLSWLKGLGS